MAVILTVIVGWAAEIRSLQRGFISPTVMVPNTALLGGLTAVGLLLSSLAGGRRAARIAGRTLAGVVVLLSALILLQSLFPAAPKVDRMLFSWAIRGAAEKWGRTSRNTAFAFALLGAAILWLPGSRPRRVDLSGALAAAAAVVGLEGLLATLFDSRRLFFFVGRPEPTAGMALHSALVLLALAAGVLAARAESGPSGLLTRQTAGAAVVRRLLPVVLAVPVALSVAVSLLSRSGTLDAPTGQTVIVLGTVVLLSWVLVSGAERIDLMDRSRLEAIAEQQGLRARAEAEAIERRKLETTLEQMPGAVQLADAQGRVVLCNRAARRLSTATDSPGCSLDLRLPSGAALPDAERPLAQALTGRPTAQRELLLVSPAGERLTVSASASPIEGPGGQGLGAVAVLEDISALKRSERLREEWTSLVAHELGQPVSVIALATRLLQGSNADPVLLKRLDVAARNLARMIEDLLDASRLEASKMKVEVAVLALEPLLAESAERAAGDQLERLKLAIDSPLGRVRADPVRVEQVVANLIANALKYGAPESEIRLEARARATSEVEISVISQGATVPAEDLPRLFDRFFRSRTAGAQATSGLGIGLYLARCFVEAHGGRIWAESEGTQTRLLFTLPVAEAAEPVASAPPAA
jgi:PAS domain S-box-containing protein